ncbi:MAG TPA: hypothetical protein VKC63_04990 [Solirubrobacterales bacterium]|nr:hypothetical protein [Solirubrobacterales bacterium]
MRGMRGPLGLLALTAALLVSAFGASSAQAAFGIARWEALTCTENTDTPLVFGEQLVGFPPAQSPLQCTKEPSSESKWFKQAGGHPPIALTDFTLNTFSAPKFKNFPEGFIKDIVVDTPEGLSVNPEATPVKCTPEQLKANPPECPAQSLVGAAYLTVAGAAPPCEKPPFPVEACPQARVKLPVYNLVPFQGVPSMVGFPTSAPGEPTFIVGSLNPVDQHVIFTISNIHPPDGTAKHPPIVGSRLVFEGKGGPFGNGTYLTNPSACGTPQLTELHVDSQEGASDAASFTTPFSGEGCDKVPFDPTLNVSVDSATDSPDPVTLDIGIPFDPKEPIANSYLKTATVNLPEGAGINPSLANGLQTCSDAQFKYHTNEAIECPGGSKIGTVDVETPSLPPDSLHGTVYVAAPTSSNPTTGNQFRVFLTVGSERYGVNVRLIGHVFPNLNTGQLKVVVAENPQATFSSFKVHINGGARGALTTPDTCGPHTTIAGLEPWSTPGSIKQPPPTSSFNLTKAAGGGSCPKTLGERPFSPTYKAGPIGTKAGAFSPFELHITRPDGAQEIRKIEATLPPGMVAKLKGAEYCPQASIDAAVASSGAAEIAHPSCPSNSKVGTVNIAVGSGPAPFHTPGTAYLAGPYKGAPISMVFVVPAVAGPYDLGTDVVRAAAYVDPETAEVHAVSDTIPYIFGGVKLDIRSIDISINRTNFTLNPTTCREPFSVRSSIFGGGANPASEAAWVASSQSSPFQATECRALKFKPKFEPKILGGKNQTKRAKNPKFQATLEARKGDANLRRAAFILPRATILDQSHIKTICTRVQLAASECPKNAIYGHAKATSPLLDGKLKGPVYLTSSSHTLPDLLVDLHGQVPIRLRGVISSEHGRLKTVFPSAPDVAVSKFVLTMKGGNKGLLINSRDLCSGQTNGFLNLKAQNSRQLKRNNLQLNIPACNGGKKH